MGTQDAAFLRSLAVNLSAQTVRTQDLGQTCDRIRAIADSIDPAFHRSLTLEPKGFDDVSRPRHYADQPIEHIDKFESACSRAKGRGLPAGAERFLGGMEHNATKYIDRAGEKPYEGLTPVQSVLKDWEKAAWYVTRGIDHLKKLLPQQGASE